MLLIAETEKSSSELSSDYERKGVTVPKRYLELDYGHGPTHPVSRGAAPGPEERGKVSRIVRGQWSSFGMERQRKSALKVKKYVFT